MIKFENKENGRYYYLMIERDLFDDFVLRIIRGGIYARRSICQYKALSEDAIEKEIQRLSRIRLQRGYTLVN